MDVLTLLIDIETSPNLAWTFETRRAFISHDAIVQPSRPICFAAKWLGEPRTSFYSEWQHTNDGMLNAAYELVDRADIVMHYNGEKFDEPRLNQEWARLGYSPPAPYERIDLWRTVNKRFDLPSQKLDYALGHFGLPTKMSTGGMKLWIAALNGEEWARRKMEDYNKNDVQIMEPLYYRLRPWIVGHPNMNLYAAEADPFRCHFCGSESVQKRGLQRTTVSAYQRYRCNDCGGWSRVAKRDFGSDLRQVAA